MPWVGEDLVRRRLLDDPPQVHDRHPVADVADDREVVGDEQHGEPEPLAQALEQVEDVRLHRDVEGGDGLVGDEEVRLERERAGDAHALPLTAGELARERIEGALAEADEVDELPAALADPFGLDDLVHAHDLGERLLHGHAGIQRRVGVLEDDLHVPPLGALPLQRLSAKADLARGRLVDPDDAAPERRLAAARLPHEPEDLALRDRQVDAVDRPKHIRRDAAHPAQHRRAHA